MNTVLKIAIEQATGCDIAKEAFDYAQGASTQIDQSYVSDYLQSLLDSAVKDPVLFNALIKGVCDDVGGNALRRCANISWLRGDTIDWLALMTSFIALGKGMYIKTQYATAEALRTNADQQEMNYEKVVVKKKKYQEVMGILIPVMEDHGFETAGEAVDFLGLLK